MSLICIGIIQGVSAGTSAERLRGELSNLAARLSVGVQFDGFLQEPFMKNYLPCNGWFAFNIADSFLYPNCEHLLCADWCNIDEERTWGNLRTRINIIRALLRCALEYGNHAELFIGESGDELTDFQLIHTSFDDMCDDIITAYHEAKTAPCIHLLM